MQMSVVKFMENRLKDSMLSGAFWGVCGVCKGVS